LTVLEVAIIEVNLSKRIPSCESVEKDEKCELFMDEMNEQSFGGKEFSDGETTKRFPETKIF